MYEKEKIRANLLDDLVTKAAYVNDAYEKDRQLMKIAFEELRLEFYHTEAALGLEIASRDRMIEELRNGLSTY